MSQKETRMALLELNIGIKKRRKRKAVVVQQNLELPMGIANQALVREIISPDPIQNVNTRLTLNEALKIHFLRAFKAANGDKSSTARMLGVTERTVYNLLKSWGIGYSPDVTHINDEFDGVSYVDFKRSYVRRVVDGVGNKSRAARELNIAIKSVYNILGD